MSVDRKKELALNAIKNFEGIPSRGLLSTLAGVHRSTLLQWEKDDGQFSDDLADILDEKRFKIVEKANKGLVGCIEAGYYPAIKDTLRILDPDNWSEPEESKTTTVNIMYLPTGPPGWNGKKPKRITSGRHRLK